MLIQAAAKQGLNFDAADALSRHWWLRARWILDQLEMDNALKLWELQHQQHLALIQSTTDPMAFQKHLELANQLLVHTYNARFPWASDDKTTRTTAEKLREAWVRRYGDPNDPKTKEKIKKFRQEAEKLMAKAQQGPQRPFDIRPKTPENRFQALRRRRKR